MTTVVHASRAGASVTAVQPRRSFTMLKTIIAAALLSIVGTTAHAAGAFGVNAAFGSSISESGGSSATAGANGNGTSNQTSYSQGYGSAYGTTSFGTTNTQPGTYGLASGGGVNSYSVTNAKASGTTSGDGYGATKSGAGVDYSSYGYGNVAGSYSTGF